MAITCNKICTRQQKKLLHATLTFVREELVYDVANYCYVEGHIVDETTEHARHMTKDVAEDGNIDRVTRVLDLCHAKAVEMLYPWTKHDIHVADEPVPWNDILDERPEYRIDLIVPDTVSQTTLNLLEKYIHEYMVCSAVADWMSITKPEKEPIWRAKVQEASDSIVSSKNVRTGGLYRKLAPF